MTTGTANFYKMRGSLSSGEFPLFSASQNLTSYLVHSVNVRYAKGLQTTVTVPAFTGYETANVVEIDGQYYWVTEWHESTTVSESITFVLDYMAPTSLLRRSDSIKGNWKRTPALSRASLQDSVSSSPYLEIRTINLSDLDCPTSRIESNNRNVMYWIQISGHDSNGNPKRFGMFIDWVQSRNKFEWVNAPYYDNTTRYVPLGTLLTNLATYTGMTESDIDDISISKRCPYGFITAQTEYQGVYYAKIVDPSGNWNTVPATIVNGYAIYDINARELAGSGGGFKTNTANIVVSLSASERLISHISIRDWNTNNIMTIPGGAYSTLQVTATMHADAGGIYTIIQAGETQIAIPEGKMPYYGNAYDNYKAYSMNYDRLAMQYAKQNADFNLETDNVVSLGNGVSSGLSGLMIGGMTGNPTTAVSGIMSGVAGGITSYYQSGRAKEMSYKQAVQNFELSKRRALDQPTGGYNVSYGTSYALLNEMSPLHISIRKPSVASSTYLSAWAEQYGYPSEGVLSITVINGYYQGILLSDSSDKSGMYWDELNRTVQTGFKFITP